MPSGLYGYYIKLRDSQIVRDTSPIVLSINKKATNLAENLNTFNPSKMGQNSWSVLHKDQLLSIGKNSLVSLYFAASLIMLILYWHSIHKLGFFRFGARKNELILQKFIFL